MIYYFRNQPPLVSLVFFIQTRIVMLLTGIILVHIASSLGKTLSWASNKQTVVAHSSTEADVASVYS